MTLELRTGGEAETEGVGEILAARCAAGTVLALRGSLGAGKTAFVRGLARGLGYRGRVTSPTFAIVNEYEGGRLPLFHFDLYRIQSPDELFDLGWEETLTRGGVCAIEWSEQAGEALPPDSIFVTITKGKTDTERVIRITKAAMRQPT